jgi:hypothetical protein
MTKIISNLGLLFLLALLPAILVAQIPDFDATKSSAEQGNASAQFNLGYMYANGEGVPENYLTAYVWLSVSAAQGDQYAKDNIDIVKNKLTTDQLAQGQTLAAKCFESNFKDCP